MIINDHQNKQLYYQCLFEPKGNHLIEHDKWKEDVLIALNDDSEIKFDGQSYDSEDYQLYLDMIKKQGYREMKCLGFKFYNHDNETEFKKDFTKKFA